MQPLRVGEVGPEVLDVQRRLEALDLLREDRLDDPGVFAAATLAAVRLFQQRRGLTADGIVGEDTWRALVEASYELGDRLLYLTRPLLRGDDVRELQRRLNQLGFDAGYVDGFYGAATADAIRDFQLNVGLPVDGIAGPDTFALLRRLHRHHQSAPAFAVRERERLRQPGRISIAGARVLVDPGHCVDSPGIITDRGIAEHEVTWAIANLLSGRLAALGARPVLARGPATSPTASQRARLANTEEVEAICSIHLNGLSSSRQAHGAAAYYFGQDDYVSELGRRIAQLAVDNIVARTGTANCRTHPSTSTLLRESRAPAVIVEPGFLTHPDEGRRLLERAYQALVADALTDALVTFLVGGTPTGQATPATSVLADL